MRGEIKIIEIADFSQKMGSNKTWFLKSIFHFMGKIISYCFN